MARRIRTSVWAKAFQRSLTEMTRHAMRAGTRAMRQAMRPALDQHKPPAGDGQWIAGLAFGPAGMRRFRLYRPSGLSFAERVPLVVMLHGCGQDANSFARSTRMNRIAARKRFLVLYPEQDLLANARRCWNWYDTRSGRAYGEAALVIAAIEQVCLLHPVDRSSIALAGLSAGASMAALLATRHPERFKAVVMHSGIAPGAARSSVQALGAMRGARTPAALPLRLAGAALPPLMVIHGGVDTIVSPGNARDAVRVWAEAAGAPAGAGRRVQRGERHAMTITEFKRKGGIPAATLCEVHGLGHAWSGGAAREQYSDMRGPDASRMVWAFAARQFRGE